MGGVISASDPRWIEPFSGLSESQFRKLVALVRRRGGDVQRGRPWRLCLEDRVLLVATYWRTNLTLRQVAPLFGISKSAADRVLDNLAPLLAISPFTESGVDRACRDAPVLADGGYQGTGALIPHRRRPGQDHLTPEQEADNAVHRRARARVEHVFSRMKNWKILHNCRLSGAGVHHAILGVARLHNLALSG
ncbi:transposase family protein [Streptomyces sp. NPDC001515]